MWVQIHSKQFTQDIIDTLGRRLMELVLPLPKDALVQAKVASETRDLIQTRIALRNRAKQIPLEIEDGTSLEEEVL